MNISLLVIIGFGFLSGIKHAFDADHVAAVSTLVSEQISIKRASWLGMFWGLGHTALLLMVGLIVLLLKVKIPDKMGLLFEIVVGAMLVVLGVRTLVRIRRDEIHLHKHHHGSEEHIHFHSHKFTQEHHHAHQSLGMGMIHGLAGSAAVTLLVLTTIPSFVMGLLYILLFGVGSVLGMVLVSSMIAVPLTFIPQKLKQTQYLIRSATGMVSIILGVGMITTLSVMK